MNIRIHTIIIILLLSVFVLHAQSENKHLPPSFFLSEESSQTVPLVRTPRLPTADLLQEDTDNDLLPLPWRFAVGQQVDYNLENSGKWTTLPDGSRIWRLRMYCPNATSMNLLYSSFYLPEGVSFYVYAPDYEQILDRLTHVHNRPNGRFATALIQGQTIVVELHEPYKLIGRSRLTIRQINRAYRGWDTLERNSSTTASSCQVDVNCSPEGDSWQTAKNSVARYLLNGTHICTGTLINNTAQDGRQLFLTAYHCVDEMDAVTNPDASDFVFYWNYEQSNCNNASIAPIRTTTGATLLANHSNADFALFELHENPRVVADVHYAGWDATGNLDATGVCIHHPGGMVKKISTHSLVPEWDNWFNTSPQNSHLKIQPWDQTPNGYSITQSGSSGAPLLSRDGLVLGQLHGGGNFDCADPENDPGIFGALSYAWDNNNAVRATERLRDWLDPVGQGANQLQAGRTRFDALISFQTTQLQTVEELVTAGTDCTTYADYVFKLAISDAPSDSVMIRLGTNGTATMGEHADFVLIPDSFAFHADKKFQDIILRIYDDALIEEEESIVVTYQIETPSDNVAAGNENQQFFATITSNDEAPTADKTTAIIFEEKFENGLGQFTTISTNATAFSTGDAQQANSTYWEILTAKNSTSFAFVNDDVCNCDMEEVLLISPPFDFSNTSDAQLIFDRAFSGQDYESLEILISTDNGQSWLSPIANLYQQSTYVGNGSYQTDWILNESISLNDYEGVDSLRFAFRYSDNGAWAYGLAIDNVRLFTTTTQVSAAVQMTVNSDAPAQAAIPPFSTVHFYDPTAQHIIATVTNDSDHDFGCTTLAVDRAGADTTYTFVSDSVQNNIFSKTLKFTPQYPSETADFTLTTYHEPQEVTAWMTIARQVNTDSLHIIQVEEDFPIDSINASNAFLFTINNQRVSIDSLGDNITTTSVHIGGLSAFGFGMAQPDIRPAPLSLISYDLQVTTTQPNEHLLEWTNQRAVELNELILERATDGKTFETIASWNTTKDVVPQRFVTPIIQDDQMYWYRLSARTDTRTGVVSPVVVAASDKRASRLTVMPHPFRDEFVLQSKIEGWVTIYNSAGQVIHQWRHAGKGAERCYTAQWTPGLYIVRMQDEILRVIKQ